MGINQLSLSQNNHNIEANQSYHNTHKNHLNHKNQKDQVLCKKRKHNKVV